jgi:hypothetical protein
LLTSDSSANQGQKHTAGAIRSESIC